MKDKRPKFEISYTALENFKEKSFEISFEVFNLLQMSENEFVKEFIFLVGSDELYQSLHYQVDLILSAFNTKEYELIDEYFTWKYSVYANREIDLEYFLVEFEIWIHALGIYLYKSHASELMLVYDYLVEKHNANKEKALQVHTLEVKEEYADLFMRLKECLLNANKEEFYKLVKQNLALFENDVFHFIEEIINPLMYEIGYMWQYNKIGVAKEHLATALTGEIIDMFLINKAQNTQEKPLVLLSTIGDESHNLGLKIIAKFLDSLGFDAKCLGTKISNKELITSIYELKPSVVLFSVTLMSNLANLQYIVNEIKSDIKIFNGLVVVGGQALYKKDDIIEIKGADFHSKSLEELKSFLNKILKNKI